MSNKLVCFFFFIIISIGISQNYLNGPESVAFDSIGESYFVSNYYGGALIRFDIYENQEIYKTGLLSCRGNVLDQDILYVSTPDSVFGINIRTDEIDMRLALPHAGNLDGLAVDTSGYLYIVDTGGKIIRVNIEDESWDYLVTSGFPSGLQDIAFDVANNRLIAVCWISGAPVLGVSLPDGIIQVLAGTSFGYFDGVTIDQYGNTYVASYYAEGRVYKFDPTFTDPPILVSSGHYEPSGIDYNRRDNIMAVPNFYDNSLDFVPIEQASVEDGHKPETFKNISNYPNPFNSATSISLTVDFPQELKFAVYDMLGREVLTGYELVPQPGEFHFTINAVYLPSGSYIYRVYSIESVYGGKMVLLK